MSGFAENYLTRHPVLNDLQAALDLIITCEIAEYGEADCSLEDLEDQWSDIDLEQDAWLVTDSHHQPAGYAAVFRSGQRFTFDFYVHPAIAPSGLTQYLLALCEARACEQLKGEPGIQAMASIIISQGNLVNRQIAEQFGYKPYQHHLRMQITMDAPPPVPVWPDGITLRTVIPGQDDRSIYNFIQAAFDRSGRIPPSFESWHETMMGAYNFESDLWILAYHGDELVGAALCFDYPQNGWVRQLGVAQHWRRRGIGSALLQHGFSIFYERGQAAVGLGVESGNINAYQLYERVGMKCTQHYIEYYKTLLNS